MLTVKILDRQTSENIMGMNVDSLDQLKERVFTIFKDPESLLFVVEGMNPFLYKDFPFILDQETSEEVTEKKMNRLQEIIEKTEKVGGYSLLISIEDIDWLIEQVKKFGGVIWI